MKIRSMGAEWFRTVGLTWRS